MKLEHNFTVKASPEETWALLTDLERIAPCMPGAELTGRDGELYKGRVKVKLGPVLALYEGKASFAEKDAAAKRGCCAPRGARPRGRGERRPRSRPRSQRRPTGRRSRSRRIASS